MNKKTCLIIFLALLAGEIAGYTGRALTSRSSDNSEKQEEDHASVRPRFGSVRQEDSQIDSRQKDDSRSGKSEMARLDDTLRRYSRMSTEELWKELEMLSKQTDRRTYSLNTTREILKSYIFTRLGQEAPRQTLALAKDEKSIFSDYRYAVLGAWCCKNPEAAMAYCRENMEGTSEESDEWKGSYIGFLAKSSPDKAMDYLFTLSPQECTAYAGAVIYQLADKSPEKMTGFMEKLVPLMKEERAGEGYIASQWAQCDWNAAEKWINTLSKERQVKIMGQVLSVLPQEEIQKKIGTLEEKGKLEVLRKLSDFLAWDSPVKALDTVLENTTEEQAATVLERGFYSLSFHDDEVRSYMNNLPAGAVRDGILKKLIRQSSFVGSDTEFFNPKIEDTFSMIDQMSSTKKKEEAIDSVLDSWVHREPQKVKAWVEQSSLPDEKKKLLLSNYDHIFKAKKAGE